MYQVLYRKYRPHNFDDVVGQKNVVKTLVNSIKNDKISHSYIFYGPRGTGKTTLAKIMARSVNCSHTDGKLLCEVCDNCKISKESECVDIIEIDAASNNGVDEIRELKSKVNLVPSSLKYKIYIIDEVHMLSIGAFNALLKTIEEPPAHSIFILATTEIDKVPETIISRCQTFAFERVSNSDIVSRLRYVADEENINISDDVLLEIAKTSEGGMRDSLGLLDKLSIYKEGEITLKDFYELNSLLSVSELDSFINCLSSTDVEKVVAKINKLFDSGKNIIQICNQLIYRMTDIIVNYYLSSDRSTEFDIDMLESLANFFNEKMFDLKRSEHPNIYFEIMVLNFLKNASVKKSNDEEKVVNTEKLNENVSVEKEEKEYNNQSVVEKSNKAEIKQPVVENKSIEVKSKNKEEENLEFLYEVNEVRVNNTFAEASKDELIKNKNLFSKFSDFTFDTKIGYLVCDIMDGNLRAASNRNVIISYEFDSSVKQNLLHINKLQDVYNKITGLNVSLALVTDKNWEKMKEEYIKNKKNGIIYEYKEEPVFSKKNSNKKIDSASLLEKLGDIVEYE